MTRTSFAKGGIVSVENLTEDERHLAAYVLVIAAQSVAKSKGLVATEMFFSAVRDQMKDKVELIKGEMTSQNLPVFSGEQILNRDQQRELFKRMKSGKGGIVYGVAQVDSIEEIMNNPDEYIQILNHEQQQDLLKTLKS